MSPYSVSGVGKNLLRAMHGGLTLLLRSLASLEFRLCYWQRNLLAISGFVAVGIRYIVIYTRVSCNMNKGIILRVFGNVKMLLICPNEYIDGTIILALMSDKDTTKKVSVETCERKLHDFSRCYRQKPCKSAMQT